MNVFYLILFVVILGLAAFIYYLKKKIDSNDGGQGKLADTINHQNELFKERFDSLDRNMSERVSRQNETIFQLQKSMDHRLGENSNRLDNAAKSYAQVEKKVAELKEATNKVFEVGKNISDLQDILKAPKSRGLFGEIMLENILSQMLPKEYYATQYRFKNGEIVDAIVKLKNGLISVDSKFPLENFYKMRKAETDAERKQYRRTFVSDVKKHVDAIASKYILADEGTLDFAFIYITAENVFYETIINDDNDNKGLAEYMAKKRIIPVSPNSFHAYLMTVAKGLQGMEIEKRTREIINNLGRLKDEFVKFGGDFSTLGTHIVNTKNKYDTAEKRLEKFGDRLEKVQIETEEEPKIDAVATEDKLLE